MYNINIQNIYYILCHKYINLCIDVSLRVAIND